VKGALRPSNAKMLYMDEKRTETGEIKKQNNRKAKWIKQESKKEKKRNCAATLSDLHPSTCLAWVTLIGVNKKLQPAKLPGPLRYTIHPPRNGDSTRGYDLGMSTLTGRANRRRCSECLHRIAQSTSDDRYWSSPFFPIVRFHAYRIVAIDVRVRTDVILVL